MSKYFIDYKNTPRSVWARLKVYETETKEEAIKQAVINHIQSNIDIALSELKSFYDLKNGIWSIPASIDLFQAVIDGASQAEFRIYEEIHSKERNIAEDLEMAKKLSHLR